MSRIRLFFRLSLTVILAALVVALLFPGWLTNGTTPTLPILNPQDNPGRPISRTDGCVVDSETAKKVHDKYEEAGIQAANEDNKVRVQTVDTKLSLTFEVPSDQLHCFRKSSLVPVTVSKCQKNRKGECNFSKPHTVYVRTLPVKIISWEYLKPAPK